ncbi:MAG: hypothetical protein KDJ90_01855 [Nitratireductor sp.]|nr:hypothetical protein [Nitratireductor sp.]
MAAHQNENLSETGLRALLAELVIGYLMIFAVFGVMFGFATGIGVNAPVAVIVAIFGLWLVLIAVALRSPHAPR